MKYILSEDELMKFNELYDVKDFLKSKTPVEQIGGAGWLEKEAVLNTEKYSGHNAIFYIEVIK